MVDIFEAGPVVYCKLNEIRIVKGSHKRVVAEVATGPIESTPFIITNTQQDFRACVGSIAENQRKVRITKETADLLQVAAGDKVRFSPLRPSKSGGAGK